MTNKPERHPKLNSNLWDAFINGNNDAYEQIYSENIELLYDFGMKVIHEQAIVEDCIHELFVDLWSKRDTIVIHISIKAYLLTSVRRKLLRYIKKSGRHNELNREASREYANHYTKDPEELLINDQKVIDKNKKLNKAVQMLSKRQQEAISLRFFNNLKFDEISSIMGISQHASYNLVSKAISTLRQLMISLVWLLIIFN